MKRVVVTGMGVVSATGMDVAGFWNNIVEGNSPAKAITRFNADKFKTHFATQIADFNAAQYLDRNEIKRSDLYTQYALIAAGQAIADSGFDMQCHVAF
jgi:3-oxoacyl-[acyl-carrier-protein] synthase II